MHSRGFYLSGEGVLWLLSLGYKLIGGKFHMFVAGTASPEHILTFMICKLLRKPILIMDSHWDWPDSLLARFLWPSARFAARHATVLAVPGKRARKFWHLSGVPVEKTVIYRYYYSQLEIKSCHVLYSEQIRRRFGNKKIVLFLGRLLKAKGVDYLIRSFARLSNERQDIVLVIIGDGPERSNLEKLSMDLGLDNVFFIGAVWDIDVKTAYFLACDVFVNPNPDTDFPEEWGLAVNEAMSAAKPIVVTKSVGCAYDLVSHRENGYIVNEGDLNALFLAMKELLEDDALVVRMGQASQNIIHNFTYENAVESLNECIELALGEFSRPTVSK